MRFSLVAASSPVTAVAAASMADWLMSETPWWAAFTYSLVRTIHWNPSQKRWVASPTESSMMLSTFGTSGLRFWK